MGQVWHWLRRALASDLMPQAANHIVKRFTGKCPGTRYAPGSRKQAKAVLSRVETLSEQRCYQEY